MSMTYSVLGRSHSEHPQPSLATLRNVSKTLDSALSLLQSRSPLHTAPEAPIPSAQRGRCVARRLLLPVEMDSALPPEYAWGTGGEAWTTWSGHEDRKTAERWLAAWRTSKIGQHRDWEIRRGDCKLGKFMPKGARIAAAMGVLG